MRYDTLLNGAIQWIARVEYEFGNMKQHLDFQHTFDLRRTISWDLKIMPRKVPKVACLLSSMES